ncbi:hypothetical protein ACQR50_15105 [Sphingomonas sp. Xoc002]
MSCIVTDLAKMGVVSRSTKATDRRQRGVDLI